MAVAIDPFLARDAAQWRALFAAYNAFYGVALPDVVYAATWQRLIAPLGPLYGLAARDARGVPIGFAHYFFYGSTWSLRDRCYLEDLFVAPEARGAGIGRALVAAVAEAGRARGCERLSWHTQESNAAARRLYDALASYNGFIRYEVEL